MSKIIERIEREAGVAGLAAILAERLAPTDLQSLLLEVFRLRARRRRPADVLADYTANRFVRPSPASLPHLAEWEQTAFAMLPPEFQPVTLSPVCPLGTNSAVAAVDQNWSVATIRNTEVVSDVTNVLALECAVRRRILLRGDCEAAAPVHLATSQRVLRGQKYANLNLAPHFSLFALCSAGRDRETLRFELTALSLHIRFYVRALRAFLGADVPLRVSVTDFHVPMREALLEALIDGVVGAGDGNVVGTLDHERTQGKGYYRDLCFHIYATGQDGGELELADGGAVDWMQRLLSNAKERLVISGIGSERVCSALIR